MKRNDEHGSISIRLITVAMASALIAPGSAQAFDAKLSGQVSRMMVAPDDAVGDEIQHQDIGWSGSRFRFTGTDEMENGMKWGFRFEIQARNNNAGTDGAQLGNNGDNQDNRYQDIYFSGDFGKISFGKGDGVANGSTEVDLSGTALSSAGPLQDCKWKIEGDAGAATRLAMAPSTLWERIKKYRLDRFRSETPTAVDRL